MNQRILLVDDEPAALNCYRQMLESEFDVAIAASGGEGLVSLRNHGPFAVVISNMRMAGGGDYYDFLDMGPGEVGFVLADVAGKGIAAALYWLLY